MIPPREIENIIDNIGIPNGGFNLAFGDSPTIGVSDGDILISLNAEEHGSTAEYTDRLRKRLNEKFPDVTFFFEAANITNQILNFGLPAPIDVQVLGRNAAANYQIASELKRRIEQIPGAADVHIHQVVDYPEIRVNVDRSKAGQVGLTQRDVSSSMLISLSGSAQIAPTQWLDYTTGVSYNVTVQTPQYRINSIDSLMRTPISALANAVNTNTATSLAGAANAGNAAVGAGPSQASAATAIQGRHPADRSCWRTWRTLRAEWRRRSSIITMCSRYSTFTPTWTGATSGRWARKWSASSRRCPGSCRGGPVSKSAVRSPPCRIPSTGWGSD